MAREQRFERRSRHECRLAAHPEADVASAVAMLEPMLVVSSTYRC
jgi:hypothetical protein